MNEILLNVFATMLAAVGLAIGGFYLYSWISLLLHEGGHILGAWITGMDVTEVRLGSGKWVRSFHLCGVDWSIRPVPAGGAAMIFPTTKDGYRFKRAVSILGGVCATVALAGLMVWCAVKISKESVSPGIESWTRSLIYGACTYELVRIGLALWPRQYERDGMTLRNDGLQLWHLLFPKSGDAEKVERLVLQGRAVRALHREDLEQSVQCLRETITRTGFPEAAPLQLVLANLLKDTGHAQEAEGLYREMINKVESKAECYRDGVDALSSLALVHNRRDMFEECEEHLRHALQHHPSTHTLKGTLGAILVEQGKGGEGRRLLEDLYQLRTNETDLAISAAYLSLLAEIRGDAETASRLRSEALRILPSDPVVKRVLAQKD